MSKNDIPVPKTLAAAIALFGLGLRNIPTGAGLLDVSDKVKGFRDERVVGD